MIGIVEKHDPEVLQIKEVFDLLVAEEPQIKKLKVHYGVHPLTLKLKPMRDQLILYISALRFQLKVAERVNSPTTAGHVVAMKLAVDAHFSDLKNSRNEEVVHQKVEEFLEVVNSTQELSEAVSSIGILELIDNLKATQSAIRRLLNERLALISQRPKEKTQKFMKSLITALKDLFKQIEVAQLKHTELDYQPLFDELNDLLNKYRYLINMRQSYNKRKAEERKNNEETDDVIDQPNVTTGTEGSDKLVETPVVTNSVMTPEVFVVTTERMNSCDVVQVNNNGLDKDSIMNLAKEKAVAMSSIPKQLHSFNGESKTDK